MVQARRELIVRVVAVVLLMLAGTLATVSLAPTGRALESRTVPAFETTTITVATRNSRTRFHVEVAISPQQRIRGLQHRTSLADDAGMLFLFAPPERVAMWMKDTLIALDIIFVAADGRVVGIHENAEPLSLAPIRSPEAVRAVLEVNAGTARRLGLRNGDRLWHPLFQQPVDAPALPLGE